MSTSNEKEEEERVMGDWCDANPDAPLAKFLSKRRGARMDGLRLFIFIRENQSAQGVKRSEIFAKVKLHYNTVNRMLEGMVAAGVLHQSYEKKKRTWWYSINPEAMRQPPGPVPKAVTLAKRYLELEAAKAIIKELSPESNPQTLIDRWLEDRWKFTVEPCAPIGPGDGVEHIERFSFYDVVGMVKKTDHLIQFYDKWTIYPDRRGEWFVTDALAFDMRAERVEVGKPNEPNKRKKHESEQNRDFSFYEKEDIDGRSDWQQ